jgi:hypothetical protein
MSTQDLDSHPSIVAAKRKLIRQQDMDALFARTKRSRNGEVGMLRATLERLHSTIEFYDLQTEPPPVAGAVESLFDASLERLANLADEAEKAKTSKG